MAWSVRILGGAAPETWRVEHFPADADEQDRAVREHFPARSLRRCAAGPRSVTYAERVGSAPARGPELAVVTEHGPDAGRLVPLGEDGLSVGRGGARLLLDDPSAPSRPMRLRLAPTGLHIHDGPRGTGRLWGGRSPLPVGRTALGLVRGPGAALPRPITPEPPTVDLGSPPARQSVVIPLVAALGPLVLGVALVLMMGNPMFLLFGVLSVTVALVMLAMQRRTRLRHARLLAARADAVVRRRARAALSPGAVARAVRSRATDRFGLTAGADEAVAVSWGSGVGALSLSRDDPDEAWVEAVTSRRTVMTTSPPESRAVVAGPPRDVAGVCRWAVFQLLRHAVAADGAFVVEAGGVRRTWWSGASGPQLLVTAPEDAALDPAWRAWRAAIGDDAGTMATARTDLPWTRYDFTGPPPAPGDTVVDLRGCTVVVPAEQQRFEDVAADGLADGTLVAWLTELADDVVDLGLLPTDDGDGTLTPPGQVGTRDAVDGLTVTLARGGDETGVVEMDLAADGPHLLIAGTTGSGKSDLLLSLLLGAAAHHPPAEVAFLLLDFKGGASFGPLGALPHTMSLETNHVGTASLRALSAIRAELHRREALFAEAGVSDYPSFRRRHPDAALPRLVVAIDELRVLVDDHPDAAAVLQRLAATGRSLGFHLILATQRATGAVGSDLRSNLGSTIALRTATEQESWDLVGTAAAARLDPRRPGSAILSTAGRPTVSFRASQWGSPWFVVKETT
ncbi:cell division protein FtsK, partial [Micrococcus luteus]|nr:cell division protein FtsK [Micrococcus luteus]